MPVSDVIGTALAVTGSVGAAVCVWRHGVQGIADALGEMFEDMRDGLESVTRRLVNGRPAKIERGKPSGADGKTLRTWGQVRWSIASLEHDLLPSTEWTHEAEDCVICESQHKATGFHPAFTPISARDFNPNGLFAVSVFQSFSNGGIFVDHKSWTCPICDSTTFNPNDIREGYCGRCHAWTRN